MTFGELRSERRLLWWAFAALLALGLAASGIFQLAHLFRGYALDQERDTAQTRLELIAASLAGELARFETVAEILAGDEELRVFLRGDQGISADRINIRLEIAARDAGALDVYLMDRVGMTLAASNWNQELSFVGREFAYRPYFQDAIAGGVGKFFAVGTTSKLRGYYFAYPILHESEAIGVVVVKMQVDHLEEIWSANNSEVLVADDSGIVFMAADARWRLRSLRPLGPDAQERINRTRQYPAGTLELMPLEVVETLSAREQIIRVSGLQGDAGALRLMQAHPMPQAGWTLILLSDLKPVAKAMWSNTSMVAAIAVALFGLLWVAFERHRRTRDLLTAERQHRSELESLVEERTRGLKNAFEELRGVQEQLVLNSRFAVMGRLSAGLSHEISQPLTAIGTHLDNTGELIARERFSEARARLKDIHRLIARITLIIRQLKNLAHGSEIELTPVSLTRVVETAKGFLSAELGAVRLALDLGEAEPVYVMAEPVLLEQVFVNLLSNASQALGGTDDPCIEIAVRRVDDRVRITVTDNGPGIDPGQLEEVFEPFVTSRSGQGGLGLGLTIVQDTMRRFGGRVRVQNRTKNRGLKVELTLKLAQAPRLAEKTMARTVP